MKKKRNMARKIKGYSLILLMVIFVSCKSGFFSYTGALVEPNNRIDLPEESAHKALLKTGDLSVHYSYARDSNRLKLTGFIEFDDSLKYNFSTIENFAFEVHFVNSDSKVIGSSIVVFFSYPQAIETIPFKHSFELPPGTYAMAFSYTGTARDVGGSDKESGSSGSADYWRFWMTPFK